MSDTGQPQTFPTRTLGQVASRITDGSHFSPVPQRQGHLIANVKDMKSGRIDFDGCTRISTIAFRELQATGCVIKNGNVLLSKDGTVGRVVVYESDQEIGALSSICIITPQDGQDARFLGHALQSHDCVRQYENAMSGSALRRLVLRDIRQIRVPTPAVDEQAKVALILDTLDTTIRQTEAIIEKLKQVKQGLLHDLLIRGIDANGKLRPPQSQAPHLYKDSPLGWIPREWEARRLQDLLSEDDPAMRSGPFGSALLKHELVEIGLPLLGIDNVHVERFDANFTRFVTEKKFNSLARYAVRPQDLMITIMGTVGRCCVVPDDIGRALSSKHTWTITLDRAKYSPLLAMLQVNYCEWVLRQFTKDEQGGIMSAIRSDTLRNLMLPTPSIGEQVEIESRMQAVSSRITAEAETLRKLCSAKSGLMDDLLTGRVRVTPLLA